MSHKVEGRFRGLFVRYETGEHDVLKTNEPVLIQLAQVIREARACIRSTLRVRRSKVSITQGRR